MSFPGAQDPLGGHLAHGRIPFIPLLTGFFSLLSHHKSPIYYILILGLLIAVVGCRPAEVTYTIVDDGTSIPVTGRYQTVGEVLAAGGPTLAPDDTVLPDRDAPADPDTPIVIDRAAGGTGVDQDLALITTRRRRREGQWRFRGAAEH